MTRIKEKATSVAKLKRQKKIFIIGMLAFPVMQFLLFYVVVNANSLFLAFQKMDVKDGAFRFAGLENFIAVFQNIGKDAFLKQLFANSFWMFLAGQLIAFPLSLIFSYYVYKKYIFAKTFRFVLFLPSIVSSIVICLVYKLFLQEAVPQIYIQLGWGKAPNFFKDPSLAMGTMIFYNIWTGFATGLILYSSAMGRIPTEIVESAQLDGITNIRELISIDIPMIFPTISTMLVLSVSGFFTAMGPAYAIYGDSAPNAVQTIGYYLYVIVIGRNASLVQFPYAAAMGIVFTMVVAPITLLVKYVLEKYGPSVDY
ncbi:MAG: carbohydrate ABC transporter permease [Candidatus Scatosoma sp.]